MFVSEDADQKKTKKQIKFDEQKNKQTPTNKSTLTYMQYLGLHAEWTHC